MSALTVIALGIACLVATPPSDNKSVKKSKADEPLPAVRFSPDMFGSTEESIYAQLNLTADQLKALRANNEATQGSYAAIRAKFKEDGDVWAKVRGYEATAKASKAETKRIMTKEQHDAYLNAWTVIMSPYIANSQKLQGSSRGLAGPKK